MTEVTEQNIIPAPNNTSNQSRSDEEGAEEVSRPRKKQRKRRPCYSCEECRRLKMKCDRQVPCSNCVRRRRPEVCIGPPNSATPICQTSDANNSQIQEAVEADPSQGNLESNENTLEIIQERRQLGAQPHSQVAFQPPTPAQDRVSSPDQDPSHRVGYGQQLNRLPHALGSLRPASISSPSAPSGNIPSFATSGHSNNGLQVGDNAEQTGSYGTLMIGQDGRSKYLGPTAGSEWLKDSETQDALDSPLITRAPTPEISHHSITSQPHPSVYNNTPIAFPFNAHTARISTRDLLSHLPPREEAWTLAESYYRYCAWHHDVAPKPQFEITFNRVYSFVEGHPCSSRVDAQEVALVYIIMAQGTIFNIEMPYFDPSAEEWLHLSERALVKGEFLSNNTVAGVQSLHLMAHLHLHLDKGRRGDNAWPLWGLVMRLAQAVSINSELWLTELTFCVDGCAINPEHCDTEFPTQSLDLSGEKSYYILRFELSQLSAEILNMAMKVRKPPYEDVIELNQRLCEFERSVPFSLRSRAAFLAMPSRFPLVQEALEASPEPSRRSMIKSFQQMNLALNISETIINLHRPYYAKALYDDVGDRLNSIYAPSFLTVIERCAIIINIVIDIHVRFPAVSNRQWNLWFHVFGCALCLGTLLLRDPANPMAAYVLTQIDASIDLFTSLIQHGAGTPRYRRNLEWLTKLRIRAHSKVSAASTPQVANPQGSMPSGQHRMSDEAEDSEDVELLGWRTRLIERAGQARQTIRTIRPPATPTGSQITGNSESPQAHMDSRDSQGHLRTIQGMSSSVPPLAINPDLTDNLLHDFWDPMLLQDIFGQDQSTHNMNHAPAWWEGAAATLDVSQVQF